MIIFAFGETAFVILRLCLLFFMGTVVVVVVLLFQGRNISIYDLKVKVTIGDHFGSKIEGGCIPRPHCDPHTFEILSAGVKNTGSSFYSSTYYASATLYRYYMAINHPYGTSSQIVGVIVESKLSRQIDQYKFGTKSPTRFWSFLPTTRNLGQI
jgi:hypothetical protein